MKDFFYSPISVIKQNDTFYPDKKYFFRPHIYYPEYYWGSAYLSEQENEIYNSVRESLHLLGLDEEHYGSKAWNPLGGYINKGDKVLIKPNLVMDINPSGDGLECLCTHPSVVAPIIDFILIALKGEGEIIIGDAPMQECDFFNLIEQYGYNKMINWYKERGCTIDLIDFRELSSKVKGNIRIQRTAETAKGKVIDLKENSEFYNVQDNLKSRMRVTNYDYHIMNEHHTRDRDDYYISTYVLDADVIINMPKPKCHRKAGVTAALKNLVGINARKEFLPHHTIGSVNEGGDEYLNKSYIHKIRSALWDRKNFCAASGKLVKARIYLQCARFCTLMLKLGNHPYSEGSWYGNHTISRTITDLNKIILYADKNGELREKRQRNMLIVADMIISGEREGPVSPSMKKVGMIVAGINSVCIDEVIITLMGFNCMKIPTIMNSRKTQGKYKLVGSAEKGIIISNVDSYNGKTFDMLTTKDVLCFEPSQGWKGHIELL